MSAETAQWLNRWTLIGNTAKRGTAWHYRADLQGTRPNHFVGSIPREEVLDLIGWEPLIGEVTGTSVTADGVTSITAPDRIAVMRPPGTLGPDDKGEILGLFKEGYQVHGYKKWLVENLELITDGGLAIGSAGLLRGGALAWVQAELEETVEAGGTGVEFRPFITAATSCDGSTSSTYLTGAQLVVCDNTLTAAMNTTTRFKIKHSSKSLQRISEIRETLGLIETVSDEFSAQVQQLCSTEVTPRQWERFLDVFTLVKDLEGRDLKMTGGARTKADNLRAQVASLYTNDPRVSPWTGTAFGVVQTVNTYHHHEQPHQKGTDRAARNMQRMVEGEWDEMDRDVVETIDVIRASV